MINWKSNLKNQVIVDLVYIGWTMTFLQNQRLYYQGHQDHREGQCVKDENYHDVIIYWTADRFFQRARLDSSDELEDFDLGFFLISYPKMHQRSKLLILVQEASNNFVHQFHQESGQKTAFI